MEKPELEEIELADGTKINVLRSDKVDELHEGFTTKNTELTAELEKEQAKDKNFANLRQKKLSELSDEEKAEISEDRQELMAQREQYESDRADDKKIRVSSWKTSALKNLGLVDPEGNIVDEETYKKVDAAFARLNDPEDSGEAVMRKVKAAYSLEFGSQPNIGERTINSAIPFGGGGNVPKRKEDMSEATKSLAGRLGIDLNPKKEEDKK